ncbi:MAG TPA: folylpolyglutamate synthase/dihydrofolate synthase family protein [Edaphocola sp.]|nr:folylpolyglutamate synthase/dihydrofolate synthase family protein [Edaphocola sp.]
MMQKNIAPKNFDEAVQFSLEQLPMFSKQGKTALKPTLDNIIRFCNHLGNPEKQFKSLHIAGTNGKGSTSNILAATFQIAGYKTGLYTSPHLIDIRERIRINGELIKKDDFVSFIQDNWQFIKEIQPSYFELNVAMAFWYFAKEKVDIAIIETGLGGTWDSTNIILPELSVITNISLDHTNILGNTIEEISASKAGIIKPNTPVVIGINQKETAKVFSKTAILNNTTLVYADLLFQFAITGNDIFNQKIKFFDNRTFEAFELETDLLGNYQLENIRTALTAIIILESKGWNVNFTTFKEAIQQVKKLTGLRGRWDKLQREPLLIADVGHNPSGLGLVAEQLNHSALKNKTKHIVTAFVSDKDVKQALSFLPQNALYYLSEAKIPRAMPLSNLAAIASDLKLNFKTFPSIAAALETALKNASKDDLVLITGSFFTVAEGLEYFDQINK